MGGAVTAVTARGPAQYRTGPGLAERTGSIGQSKAAGARVSRHKRVAAAAVAFFARVLHGVSTIGLFTIGAASVWRGVAVGAAVVALFAFVGLTGPIATIIKKAASLKTTGLAGRVVAEKYWM